MLQPSDRDTVSRLITLRKQGIEWQDIPEDINKEYNRIFLERIREKTQLSAEINTAINRLLRCNIELGGIRRYDGN